MNPLFKIALVFGIIFTCCVSKADTLQDIDYYETGGNYYCYPWLNADFPQQTLNEREVELREDGSIAPYYNRNELESYYPEKLKTPSNKK